jgi:hypothetical protein
MTNISMKLLVKFRDVFRKNIFKIFFRKKVPKLFLRKGTKVLSVKKVPEFVWGT